MTEKVDTIISTTQDKVLIPGNVEQEVTTTAHYTEYVDSHTSKWETIKKFPFACFCIGAMIFTLVLTSFESQAGGIVISISMFRKHVGVLSLMVHMFLKHNGNLVYPWLYKLSDSGQDLG